MSIILILFSTDAFAKKIKFVSVGWTGVTVKTELGVKVLKSLGYDAENIMVSVPIAYKAMATGDADIFLGNWMPSMESIAGKYFKRGSVIKYVANMLGAQYTLAVPSYAFKGGLKDFSDIAKFGDKLDWKIYGIEEGNDGNKIIQDMIDKNMFNLGKFKLISSSEAGMLSQVKGYTTTGKWAVFLGWAPHYMNEIIDMKYLTGSTAETFGGNNGTAVVYTNIRKGFDKEEPNIATFLKNFKFSTKMMNQIMTNLHKDENLKPVDAGLTWIKAHPAVYSKWLEGVKTVDGKSALATFRKYISSVK